jgi:PAS domain S-box-containing protein
VKLPSNKRLVFVGFWAAVAILAGIGIATHQSLIQLVATSGRVEHTRQLSDQLQQLLFGLQEAEVDTRGFIRSGDQTLLRRRAAALRQVEGAIRQLDELCGGDTAQKGNADALGALIGSHRALYDSAIALGRDKGAEEALQLVDTERSRSMTDQIHTTVESMQDRERRLLLRRDEELRLKAETSIAVFIVGGFISLTILLGVFLFMNMQVTARELAERALAEEKRSLEERVQDRTAALSLTNEQLLHEIHDHQVAEQAARESEQKYRDLIEGAYDMIQSVAPTGQILSVNRAWLKTLGYTEAELPRLTVFDIIHPDSQAHCQEVFDRLRDGESATNLEVKFLTKDARAIPVEGNATVLLRDGEVVATHGFFRDVSERKRAEQALRESQHLLQSTIDALSSHIAILDENGFIIAVNRQWRQFADENDFRVPQHGVGLNYLRVCEQARGAFAQEGPEVAAGIREVINGGRAEFRLEYPCHRGAIQHWFQVRVTPLAKSQPVRVAVAHENITEIKHAEQALRELSGRLLQLQDEERRRIARELHDVTAQNLSAVTLNLARLEKMIPETDEKIRKVLTESLALGEESLREIRTLSYLLHPPMLDESGLAVALEWYLDGFSKRSGLRVNLAAPPDLGRLPAEVETALFRVVQESLTNIHRHSGSKVAAVQFTRDADSVTLAVKDEGRGMPRPGPDGSAMGVGIRGMRERLHQLGGRLEINSSQRGTTVRAVLPLGGKQS